MSAEISNGATAAPPPTGAVSPVTLWFRRGDNGFEYNHLEEGHALSDRPAPKAPTQVGAWSKGVWVREHAWLDSSLPAKVIHDPQNLKARWLASSHAIRGGGSVD